MIGVLTRCVSPMPLPRCCEALIEPMKIAYQPMTSLLACRRCVLPMPRTHENDRTPYEIMIGALARCVSPMPRTHENDRISYDVMIGALTRGVSPMPRCVLMLV